MGPGKRMLVLDVLAAIAVPCMLVLARQGLLGTIASIAELYVFIWLVWRLAGKRDRFKVYFKGSQTKAMVLGVVVLGLLLMVFFVFMVLSLR